MPALVLSLKTRLAAAEGVVRHGNWRLALVAFPHAAALALMAWSETAILPGTAFLLTWGVLNFIWLALLRRPALAGALSLALITVLTLVSQLKHNVLMMTANFVDLMIIDVDAVAFLFTIFSDLRWEAALAATGAVPVLVLMWLIDPFRVRRPTALAAALACLGGLAALGLAVPLEPIEAFQGGNHVSGFARSGVDALAELMTHGLMESDAVASDRLTPAADPACQPAGKPLHIILVHDESSFDIRMAPDIKVPTGYGAHFASFDGKERRFVVETAGGASWFAEYNVLAGLSARSFGRFRYLVTRIAAGRVERGLPHALRRCGYRTYSLYSTLGTFMSARSFQATTGVQHFYDRHDLGARNIEPDTFFYDAAARTIAQERAHGPMFVFVVLAANHLPWDYRYRPDLMPHWQDLGNVPPVDEYLRRQAMSAQDYAAFLARLKRDFPDDAFLLVRFGDHQPDFASYLMEPGLDEDGIARRHMVHDPRYFTTYYAIDTWCRRLPACRLTRLSPSRSRSCGAATACSMRARAAPRRGTFTGC